jgi:hypothetical protein
MSVSYTPYPKDKLMRFLWCFLANSVLSKLFNQYHDWKPGQYVIIKHSVNTSSHYPPFYPHRIEVGLIREVETYCSYLWDVVNVSGIAIDGSSLMIKLKLIRSNDNMEGGIYLTKWLELISEDEAILLLLGNCDE